MTSIRLFVACLLAAVVVISLAEQKWELTRGECCALPSLPAAPEWTGRMTAAAPVDVKLGQPSGERAGRVRASTPAVLAGLRPGRAPRVVTVPIEPRGWERSIWDPTVVTGLGTAETRAHVMLVNPSVKDGTVVCRGEALLDCGFGSPKKDELPLNLRQSGAGIALTISNTDIWIEPGRVRFSRSVSF